MLLTLAVLLAYQNSRKKARTEGRGEEEGEGEAERGDGPNPGQQGGNNRDWTARVQEFQQPLQRALARCYPTAAGPELHSPQHHPLSERDFPLRQELQQQQQQQQQQRQADHDDNGESIDIMRRVSLSSKRRSRKKELKSHDATPTATPTSRTTTPTTATQSMSTSMRTTESLASSHQQQQQEQHQQHQQHQQQQEQEQHHHHHQQLHHEMDISIDTTTSFRPDVRREWIHAVFGTDFPNNAEGDANRGRATSRIQQGVGLAKVAKYTAYSVTIPSKPKLMERMVNENISLRGDDSTAVTSTTMETANTVPVEDEKLGLTLSRLALGLYVRSVERGSEAWCAGVLPYSVLVAINDLCLLAEPSKQALERIWQYEGLYDPTSEASSSSSSSFSSTTTPANAVVSNGLTSGNDRQSSTFLKDEPLGKTSRHGRNGSNSKGNSSLMIQEPIRMTFILHGETYSVLLLSNPPYGIEWAPCGNFALVKRAYSHGSNAGVKRGSIIAQINDDKTIYDLDHIIAATELRETFESQEPIRMQLCFVPSEARSGHYERGEDLQRKQQLKNRQNGTTSPPPLRDDTSSPPIGSGSRGRRRPKAAAQHDGVEVRIYPLRWNPHELYGPIASSSSWISQLAARVAAGEIFSESHSRTYYSNQLSMSSPPNPIYRSCPPMDRFQLIDFWDIDDALVYLLKYHQANYDERELLIHTSAKVGPYLKCIKYLSQQQSLLSRFLLPLMCYASFTGRTNQAGSPKATPFEQLLMDIASKAYEMNCELVYRMEFCCMALGNDTMKAALANIRTRRTIEMLTHGDEPHKDDMERAPPLASNGSSTSGVTTPASQVYVYGRENDDSAFSPASTATSITAVSQTLSPNIVNTSIRQRPKMFAFFRKRNNNNNKVATNNKSTNKKSTTSSISPRTTTTATSTTRQHQSIASKEETSTLATPRTFKSEQAPQIVTRNATTALASPRHPPLPLSKRRRPPAGHPPRDVMFANTLQFLEQLEKVCQDIEKSLLRSFSQKIATFALQPWSASKETALAQVTSVMRERLNHAYYPSQNQKGGENNNSNNNNSNNGNGNVDDDDRENNENAFKMPLLNPLAANDEILLSLDTDGCYILPSAHFPLLLTFDCSSCDYGTDGMPSHYPKTQNSNNQGAAKHYHNNGHRHHHHRQEQQQQSRTPSPVFGPEVLYRTTVEMVELKAPILRSSNLSMDDDDNDNDSTVRSPSKRSNGHTSSTTTTTRAFAVHGSVAGLILESGRRYEKKNKQTKKEVYMKNDEEAERFSNCLLLLDLFCMNFLWSLSFFVGIVVVVVAHHFFVVSGSTQTNRSSHRHVWDRD